MSQDAIDDAIKKGLVKLDEKSGMPKFLTKYETIGSDWTDISGYTVNNTCYPTENSEAVLERVILSASKEESIIFDCFMGSGTTQLVAQKLNRRWIGCDINKGAIQTTSKRLQKLILGQYKDNKQNGNQHNPNGEKTKYQNFVFSHYN